MTIIMTRNLVEQPLFQQCVAAYQIQSDNQTAWAVWASSDANVILEDSDVHALAWAWFMREASCANATLAEA
jgi:hypothetical protein